MIGRRPLLGSADDQVCAGQHLEAVLISLLFDN